MNRFIVTTMMLVAAVFGGAGAAGAAPGGAYKFEPADRKVKTLRVIYAEKDLHGAGRGMLVQFNNGSVWWFPACRRETSRNCSWVAKTAGNRVGKSFVDLRGKTVYLIPR